MSRKRRPALTPDRLFFLIIMSAPLEAIRWAPGPKRLALLDQRLLPGTMEYIDIAGADEAWTAIKVRRGRRSWEDG
jgi:hypothetical protein